MKFLHLPIMAAGLLAAASACATPRVNVMVEALRPGAVINKNIYGQDVEHPGAGIDGGMWVGPASKIPNIKGWRKDVVAALKELRTPVLRWPGGCNADAYNWRDGIGPRDRRALRIDPHRDGVADSNAVGTHEYFDLVELLGADAYVNGNVGTGSPREAAEWVEYMVAEGGSTLTQLRAKNGRSQPFKVAFFGVGNAPWGCGGNMTPQYYADLYNQFAVFIRGKGDKAPKAIASGSGAEWTDELSTRKRIRDYRHGISAHNATAATERREGSIVDRSAATGFGEDQWISTLNWALRMDEFIASNVAKLDKNDPANKIPLVIGEWGARDDPVPRKQNALGDALVAALHFHAFHAHAGRVNMASMAQAPNAHQAMIQAKGDALVLTPTYHAFRMHVPFQDATSLPVKLGDNPQYTLGSVGIPTVSASAARAKNGKLYLSLVNTNPKQAVAVAIGVAGGVASAASGSVLTAGAMDAHNSAASPKSVAPAPLVAHGEQGKLLLTLAPKSLTVLAIDE